MKVLIGSETNIGQYLSKNRKFDKIFKSSDLISFDQEDIIDELILNLPDNISFSKQGAIEQLLISSKINKLIFVTSVNVYRNPIAVSEAEKPLSSYDNQKQLRIDFEKFVLSHFQNSLIVRLPTVFGLDQENDFLFNLKNDTNLHDVNLNSSFQWYNINNLNNDLSYFSATEFEIVNLVVEPIETKIVINKFFPDRLKRCAIKDREEQDVWSIYPGKMLNTVKYFYDKNQVLRDLEKFIKG